jgi:hypothetical protein
MVNMMEYKTKQIWVAKLHHVPSDDGRPNLREKKRAATIPLPSIQCEQQQDAKRAENEVQPPAPPLQEPAGKQTAAWSLEGWGRRSFDGWMDGCNPTPPHVTTLDPPPPPGQTL